MNALWHSPPLIRGTTKRDRNVNYLNRNGIKYQLYQFRNDYEGINIL